MHYTEDKQFLLMPFMSVMELLSCSLCFVVYLACMDHHILVWLICVHFFCFVCILLFILLSVSLLCHDIVRWPYLARVAGCKTEDVQ